MNFNHEKLSKLLRQKRIRLCELAKASNAMAPQTLSAIVSGWIKPGHKRLADLIAGMIAFGFTRREINQIIEKNDTKAS